MKLSRLNHPTSILTASHVGQFSQSRVDNLISLLQHTNQFLCLTLVVGGEKGIRCATLQASPSTSNAMNVVFSSVGVVKVDHKFNILHI